MTTPNDPPLSRRAARLAQRAAQGEEHRETPSPADASGGSFGASRPSAADAIEYRTEVRPRVPRYEPLTPASVSAASVASASAPSAESPAAPPLAPPPTAPASGQRVRTRDFAPTDRGARPTFAAQQADDAALDYRTQGGPAGSAPASAAFSAPAFSAPAFSAPAFSAPASSAPAAGSSAPAAPASSAPGATPAAEAPAVDPAFDALDSSGAPGLVMPEYTMTRRELRALRAAAGGEAPEGAAPDAGDGAATADGSKAAGSNGPQPDDVQATAARETGEQAIDAADSSSAGAAGPAPIDPFDALLSAPRADEDPAREGRSGSSALSAPASAAGEEPAPLHLWQPSGSAAPAPLIEPAPPAPGEVAAPAESTATGSHWSAGFSEPADDPFENTFSRQVGSAAVSTNALVLPEMPVGSLAGPVPGTGEIIITGMVDVPSSIASTGAVPSVHDSPDLDDLVDASDREFVSTDSAPVSATSAVSSHTATRNVISSRRPNGNTLTTVLIISTVVMAIAAVTIFVVAATNGLF